MFISVSESDTNELDAHVEVPFGSLDFKFLYLAWWLVQVVTWKQSLQIWLTLLTLSTA